MLLHVPDQRILKGAPATLRAELFDADGEVDDIDSGVTVTVTRLDGTALVTAQAATCTNGAATYSLTAAQTGAGLDILTCEWTHNSVVRTTTYAEVVGRHWFAPSRLKVEKGVANALQSAPAGEETAVLVAARTWIETVIEWATGISWTPRTTIEAHDARNGDSEIILDQWFPRSLRSLTIDDVAEDVDDWSMTRHGLLRRTAGGTIYAADALGVSVRYDYGLDAPPAPLVEAALVAAADRVTSSISVLGNRLTGTSGAFGTISYASMDERHPTGIMAVDAAILAHRMREPGHV